MKPDELERRDTGRMGWRWPEEVPDGRPVIDVRPFWTNESERLTYEHAAETHPRRPGEGPISYIQRLAGIAAGRLAVKQPPAKAMPPKQRTLTDAEWNERNNALQKQREAVEPKESA